MFATSSDARRLAAAAVVVLIVALGGASTASAQPLPYQCELRPPPYGPNPVACVREIVAGIAPAACTDPLPPDPLACLAELLRPIPASPVL